MPAPGQIVVPPCAVHNGKVHRTPRNLTVEQHHVIPVAWQLFWQPPQPWPFPGVDPDGRGSLWDRRTVAAAPTCHRNVHALIVPMMHLVRDGSASADAQRAVGAQRVSPTIFVHSLAEFDVAVQALDRFAAAGGGLAALAGAGELGAA